MLNFVKAAGLAAALAVAPLAASALTLDADNTIVNGGNYDVQAGPYFFGSSYTNTDTAGSWVFSFTNYSATSQTIALAIGTVLQSTLDFLGGVSVTWGNSGATVTIAEGVTDTFTLTTLLSAGETDTLTVTYGDPASSSRLGRGDIDLTVAAVPVPAAGLLLLSGLGLMGAMRRRKAA